MRAFSAMCRIKHALAVKMKLFNSYGEIGYLENACFLRAWGVIFELG
jgi:hypothetical protein